MQEKQKASERHIEELSEKVQSLELEKRQLQAALEKAALAAKVRAALTSEGYCLVRGLNQFDSVTLTEQPMCPIHSRLRSDVLDSCVKALRCLLYIAMHVLLVFSWT